MLVGGVYLGLYAVVAEVARPPLPCVVSGVMCMVQAECAEVVVLLMVGVSVVTSRVCVAQQAECAGEITSRLSVTSEALVCQTGVTASVSIQTAAVSDGVLTCGCKETV